MSKDKVEIYLPYDMSATRERAAFHFKAHFASFYSL